jgi:hypothetical protein
MPNAIDIVATLSVIVLYALTLSRLSPTITSLTHRAASFLRARRSNRP